MRIPYGHLSEKEKPSLKVWWWYSAILGGLGVWWTILFMGMSWLWK